MDKKNIFVVGAVLIVVLVVGAILSIENTDLKSEESETAEQGTITEAKEIQAVMIEAGEKQDVFLCKKIKEEKKQEQCVSHVVLTMALDKKDADICEEIGNEPQVAVCKNNVFFSQAVGSGDSSFCDKMSNELFLARCLESVAELPQ